MDKFWIREHLKWSCNVNYMVVVYCSFLELRDTISLVLGQFVQARWIDGKQLFWYTPVLIQCAYEPLLNRYGPLQLESRT